MNTLDKKTLGERVAQLRNSLDLSQSELARKIDKSPQAIQKIEKGGNAREDTVIALAKALNTSKAYLLVGDEPEFVEYQSSSKSTNKTGLLVEWRNIGLPYDELIRENLVIDKIALLDDSLEGDIVCAVIVGGEWMNLIEDTIGYIKRDINLEDIVPDSYIVIKVNDKYLLRKYVEDGDHKFAISTSEKHPKSIYEVNNENFIGLVLGIYISL